MMNKLTLLLISLLFITGEVSAQKWYNPEESAKNPIEGQYWHGEKRASFYNRMPDRCKDQLREVVWNLSNNSAGESILFRTNSKSIKVRYALTTPGKEMPHMPKTGASGVDLYAYDRDGNNFRLSAAAYSFADSVEYRYEPIAYNGSAANKGFDYELYLPLYNGVEKLEIGVDDGSFFEFAATRSERPVVVYGTSIAQGACASRPGMAWSSIVSREMDLPLYNFGFSGSGELEDGVIDALCEIDALVYVLDCMPNLSRRPYDELVELVCKQVRALRAKHSSTPILLVDHAGYPDSNTIEQHKKLVENSCKAQAAAYEILKKEGVAKLYYLDQSEIALSAESFVDYVHPSDYGMKQYAIAYEKKLREIVSMPQGNSVTTIAVRQRREPNAYEWMDRHNTIISECKKGDKRGAFIGNSIFHHWGGVDGFVYQKADDVWKENFNQYINMGCGWDRIENVLWRVERGELDFQQFESIVLKIGTNNLSVNHTDEQILEGLDKLIAAIHDRQKGASIFVAGILPRGLMEARIKELNVKIEQLVSKHKYAKYGDISDGLLLENGKIDETMFSDGLHPNKAGYVKMARNIRKYIGGAIN